MNTYDFLSVGFTRCRYQHRFSTRQLAGFALVSLFMPLSQAELSPYASLTVDSSQVLSGGLQRDFTSRVLFDGGVNYQHDKHSVFISYQAQRGDIGSDSVGDIQAYSNIDEDNFSRWYEVYYQYDADQWYLRLGKTDANGEFAVNDYAANFINSSMGFSPTIVGFPTYPSPALSVLAGIQIDDDLQLAAGVYAAQDYDDFAEQFYVAELRYQLSEHSLLKLGWWHDSNQYPLATSVDEQQASTSGYYLLLQNNLPDTRWFGSQSSHWYGQLGYADEKISEINWHFGTGIEFVSPFGRSEHSMGIGLSYVKLSPLLLEDATSETAIEAFYSWPLHQNLLLKPDLQYIISPSGNPQINNALVFTLRLELSY